MPVSTSFKFTKYILNPSSCISFAFSEQTKGNLKVTSPEDVEHLNSRQASSNGSAPSRGDAKGSRTVPRRHTLGGARTSREILAMQPPDMDKKREAFLEHLKQKYPHHASAIMGHQERLRDQVSGFRQTRTFFGCRKCNFGNTTGDICMGLKCTSLLYELGLHTLLM